MRLFFLRYSLSGFCLLIVLIYFPALLSGQVNKPFSSYTFTWPAGKRVVPQKDLFTRTKGKTILKIPLPGAILKFNIRENKFIRSVQPDSGIEYQSFSGRDSLDNPVYGYYYGQQIHLSYYQNGQIITIIPTEKDQDTYQLSSTEFPDAMGEIVCHSAELPEIEVRNGGTSVSCQSQSYSSHSFDLFVVCTGEWGSYYGSKSAARQGIADHVTALNALYRAELNISFNLITEDQFLYTNRFQDEFIPSIGDLADQASNFFSTNVNTPFDIGHVMHYLGSSSGLSASGVAYLSSSCDDDYKGGGWTGTNSPGNISFTMQVFGHEIGHQLGADHDFYGSEGNCSGSQRSRGNGFEPGSGSTIMSYEGQCGSHNLDGPRSGYMYFNTHSVSQILNRINSNSSCGFNSGNGYNLSVQIPNDFSLPRATAFDLTATGGNSAYSYIWEQYDTDNTSANSTRGNPINGGKYASTPMYRSYDPSANGNHRSFPSKAVQSSGTSKKGEVYATVARDITMRLMTRSGGTIRCDEMTVEVRNAPPFRIEKPLKNDLVALSKSPIRASQMMTVQWETGETESNGFPTIDIFYSTDGGQSFPYLLADDVPNDGEQLVRPPEIDTDKARLKIMLSDGSGRMAIYHENKGNFTVSFSITPIEIAEFKGKQVDDHHAISWLLNNTGEYIRSVNIEYSYDGINFHSIAIPDFEPLNKESQWEHEYISYFNEGTKTFYRLAIENGENKKIYSSVIVLKNHVDDDHFISIHPNPIRDHKAQLEMKNFLQPEAQIRIWSINGIKMCETHSFPVTKAVSLPFSFPDGLYIVEVINGSDLYRKKVIVQRN